MQIKNAYLYSMELIRNKVQESGILTIDLVQFKPKTAVKGIDFADQLVTHFDLACLLTKLRHAKPNLLA